MVFLVVFTKDVAKPFPPAPGQDGVHVLLFSDVEQLVVGDFLWPVNF